MSKIIDFLYNFNEIDDYGVKKQLLDYFYNVIEKDKNSLTNEEAEKFFSTCVNETVAITPLIESAQTFREKDNFISCAQSLVMLENLLKENYPIIETADDEEKSNALKKVVCDASAFDFSLMDLLDDENPKIEDAKTIVDYAETVFEEYQKGKFYHILLKGKENLQKLPEEIKNLFAEHTVKDLKRYLGKDNLDEDEKISLEILVDVCCCYANDEILTLLQKVIDLGFDCINYYAIGTMFEFGKEVKAETVLSLAKSLKYAFLTYELLSDYGMLHLYPNEYASREYLAKSDLVHWLTYPTELGKEPDEIELLGNATVKDRSGKSEYYIFKYRSDSDTLSDDVKNQWLIGWSDCGGNTFSDFHLLSDFDKGSNEKTVKNIVKKILK